MSTAVPVRRAGARDQAMLWSAAPHSHVPLSAASRRRHARK
jgi:hypothetical protein